MATRIAVLTDALSNQHFFPVWHGYYGALFGPENLYVITYTGGTGFDGIPLGGLVRLPVGYDDTTRANVISDFVATLLGAYDVVVRVDADELLVVDPRAAPDLRTYIEASRRPYYTARGFDVVQTSGEAPMHDGLLLPQRKLAYPNTAGNKTAITRVPLHWSSGFHWCSAYPDFGPLFMLHLKRIDVDWQMRWFAEITRNISANKAVAQEIKDYYIPDRDKILAYHEGVSIRARIAGIENWYRETLQQNFLGTISYNPADDIYYGEFAHDHVLCEIPLAWKQLF